MAITIENPEVEMALRALAEETGESLTEAAGIAIRERLARLREAKQGRELRTLRALFDILEDARQSAIIDARPTRAIRDELWGDS